MSKPISIFSISRSYTRCEIWHGSRAFHNRVGTSAVVPDKGLTRRERYEVIARYLNERCGFPAPSYRPTKREQSREGKR